MNLKGFYITLGMKTRSFSINKLSMTHESPISENNRINRNLEANMKRLINSASMVSTGVLLTSSLNDDNIAKAADDKPKKKVKKPKVYETPSGIKYLELKKGSGPYPNKGDFCVISYTAYLSDGTIFDDRERKGGKPVGFRYGEKQIIQGLEDVLESMQPGGERTCTIPADLAYGTKGVCLKDSNECLVPPNETLKYFVKLKSVGAGYN